MSINKCECVVDPLLGDFFLQNVAWGGSPRSAHSYQISQFWLKNVGLHPPKSRKFAFFGINLPLWENFAGPQKKLNIGAQLQTFLYAMTP